MIIIEVWLPSIARKQTEVIRKNIQDRLIAAQGVPVRNLEGVECFFPAQMGTTSASAVIVYKLRFTGAEAKAESLIDNIVRDELKAAFPDRRIERY